MKKNVLALSIAAMIGGLGFAGAVSAEVIPGRGGAATWNGSALTASTATDLVFSEGGVGHQLLVPYYTAQDGNMTVLHVVNTDTANGKAVKVRFRGASNSDDVLDFQVFLSPQDVWTAAVSAGADGVAQIVTADNTCTVPRLVPGTPQSFITTRVNPNSDKAEQTREGYVEIFNIADIPSIKDARWAVAPSTTPVNSPLYTLTKHKDGVAPCSAGGADWTKLEEIAIASYPDTAPGEAAAAAAGFNTPTGGLYGDWYIINVPKTTTFSGGATALRAVDGTGSSARGNFVHFPQNDGTVTNVEHFTADPLFRVGSVNLNNVATTVAALEAGNYDLPDFSTPYLVAGQYPTGLASNGAPLQQAATLTEALAVKSVTNQYATDATISAKTDWVFSMPTRRYSVAANYAILAESTNTKGYAHEDYRLFSVMPATVTTPWFRPRASAAATGASNTTVDANGNICVSVDSQKFYDREETEKTAPATGSVFSPAKPGVGAKFALCGEVNVLAFKDAGVSVLGASSNIARQTAADSLIYTNGWGVFGTNNGGAGLPILGASFIKLTNPSAGTGFSGTYGITWPHRYTK
ncbi:cell surface protein [Acidovorax temperans]|uniref:cell surface protein n=1 Tax=Acidovorax temperans TaxID=80878 RepID=UPI002898E0DC|nr:cell surface protein [Acidovorax temperans]